MLEMDKRSNQRLNDAALLDGMNLSLGSPSTPTCFNPCYSPKITRIYKIKRKGMT